MRSLSVTPVARICAVMLAACCVAFYGCQGAVVTSPRTSELEWGIVATSDGSGAAPAYYYFMLSRIERNAGDLGEARWYLRQAICHDPQSVMLRMELADLLVLQNDVENALPLIEQVLAKDPNHLEALTTAGRIYQQQGIDSAAKAMFERALRLAPDDPNLFLHLGNIYWNENDPVNALQVFDQMAERFPLYYAAHYFRGKALAALGRFEQAEHAFRSSLELEPTLEEPYLELIEIYRDRNQVDQLIQTYQRLLLYHPDNSRAALELADLYQRTGQEALGVALLQELGRRSESDGSILAVLFEQYYETEAFDTAVRLLEGMLQGAPSSAELHYLAGLVHDGLKDTEKALAHFSQVDNRSHFYNNATVHQAFLLHDMGRIDQAIRVVQQALVHDPRNAQYYLYIGSFHEELEHYDEALDTFKSGIAVDDQNARLFFRMGVVSEKLGRHHDVIDAMKRVLQLKPDDADALNYLGYTYAELGIHLDEAETLIRKALSLKPEDGYITDSLAWVYYKMGRYDEALVWMRKALALVPDDPTMLEHMGDIYFKLEETEKALQYYRRALDRKDSDRDGLEDKIRSLQQSL